MVPWILNAKEGNEGECLMKWATYFLMLITIQVHALSIKEVDVIDNQGQTIGRAGMVVTDKGSLVRVRLWSMSPGWHGMHLHANPDCSDPENGFLRSGAHLNMHNHEHGMFNHAGSHIGDLANIYAMPVCKSADKAPVAMVEQWLPWITTADQLNAVALVIHERADDYQSNPAGDSGKRLACAVLTLRQTSI